MEIYDVLGRRIEEVFEGPIDGDSPSRIEVSADALPNGLYVLQVTGENFSEAKMVTVLR